jgi:hypothetical protein
MLPRFPTIDWGRLAGAFSSGSGGSASAGLGATASSPFAMRLDSPCADDEALEVREERRARALALLRAADPQAARRLALPPALLTPRAPARPPACAQDAGWRSPAASPGASLAAGAWSPARSPSLESLESIDESPDDGRFEAEPPGGAAPRAREGEPETLAAALARALGGAAAAAALVRRCQQGLHVVGAGAFSSLEATAAGVLALLARARVAPAELGDDALLAALWILESWSSQSVGGLSDCLAAYTALSGAGRAEVAARRAGMLRWQWALLTRAGWRMRLDADADLVRAGDLNYLNYLSEFFPPPALAPLPASRPRPILSAPTMPTQVPALEALQAAPGFDAALEHIRSEAVRCLWRGGVVRALPKPGTLEESKGEGGWGTPARGATPSPPAEEWLTPAGLAELGALGGADADGDEDASAATGFAPLPPLPPLPLGRRPAPAAAGLPGARAPKRQALPPAPPPRGALDGPYWGAAPAPRRAGPPLPARAWAR